MLGRPQPRTSKSIFSAAMPAGFALVATTSLAHASLSPPPSYHNEIVRLPGHDRLESYSKPLPRTYVNTTALPDDYDWGRVNGTSFLTRTLNQHIPQYCGSCWAHGAMSAFADRIKIARHAQGIQGPDVSLAIQYILNCGNKVAGTCLGGSHTGTYQFVADNGATGWPYETCLQYEACSKDSEEGACKLKSFACDALNTCRTCSTFSIAGGHCTGISSFPNATIAEYGVVKGEADMMAEIYARGPIACDVDATPLHEYVGGVLSDTDPLHKITNHIVSVVGWGTDATTGTKYWHARNSWGEYWGELGYFRLERGGNQLGLEGNCGWATPATWTERNFACFEDGSNCLANATYRDPSGV